MLSAANSQGVDYHILRSDIKQIKEETEDICHIASYTGGGTDNTGRAL